MATARTYGRSEGRGESYRGCLAEGENSIGRRNFLF